LEELTNKQRRRMKQGEAIDVDGYQEEGVLIPFFFFFFFESYPLSLTREDSKKKK